MSGNIEEDDFEQESTGTELNVHLFGKPSWEIEGLEGGHISHKKITEIRKLGSNLKTWLERVAEVCEILSAHGWELTGTLYDIKARKDIDNKEALKELKRLRIDNDVQIFD